MSWTRPGSSAVAVPWPGSFATVRCAGVPSEAAVKPSAQRVEGRGGVEQRFEVRTGQKERHRTIFPFPTRRGYPVGTL